MCCNFTRRHKNVRNIQRCKSYLKNYVLYLLKMSIKANGARSVISVTVAMLWPLTSSSEKLLQALALQVHSRPSTGWSRGSPVRDMLAAMHSTKFGLLATSVLSRKYLVHRNDFPQQLVYRMVPFVLFQ